MTWSNNNGVWRDKFRKDKEAERKFGFGDSVASVVMSGGNERKAILRHYFEGWSREEEEEADENEVKGDKVDEGSFQGFSRSMS